jgi:hypothetical protein
MLVLHTAPGLQAWALSQRDVQVSGAWYVRSIVRGGGKRETIVGRKC